MKRRSQIHVPASMSDAIQASRGHLVPKIEENMELGTQVVAEGHVILIKDVGNHLYNVFKKGVSEKEED
jgi:hypothetical protein